MSSDASSIERIRRTLSAGSAPLTTRETAEEEHAGQRLQRRSLRLSYLRRSRQGGGDDASVGSFQPGSSRTFSTDPESSQSEVKREQLPSVLSTRELGSSRRGGSFRASNTSRGFFRGSTSSAGTYTHDRKNFGGVGPEVTLLRLSLELEREAKMAEALGKSLRTEFDSLDLVGRDNEISVLRECLCRLTETSKKELVLVSGHSGTGKTSLVDTLAQTMEQSGGVFVRGKYELERSKGQPLTGIALACSELCREFLEVKNRKLCGEVGRELRENIDEPLLELLGVIIPRLSLVLAETSAPNGGIAEESSSSHLDESADQTSSCLDPADPSMPADDDKPTPAESKHKDIPASKPITNFLKRAKPKRSARTDDHQSVSSRGYQRRSNPGVAKPLLEFSLRTFLRIVASKLQEAGSVVAMVLDDLQWADLSSLEMLQAVARDPNISNLFLIGCYRAVPQVDGTEKDEDKHTESFSQCIAQLKEEHAGDESHDSATAKANESGCTLTEVVIGNLSEESVNELISEVLSVSAEDVVGLSQICFKRTLGNAFFVKIFLMTLEEKGMLTFRLDNGQFTWDQTEVEEETAATDNVVDLLQAKLDKYSAGMLLLLQLASSLGSSFDAYTLELLWDSFAGQAEESSASITPTIEKDSLPDLLNVCVQDMLLEPLGQMLISESSPSRSMSTSYRFVHDKIQESVMSLIPTEEFDAFRSAVGRCLFHHLCEEDLENILFVVADLLNNGMNTGTAIAELNLMAADKAKDFSAFFSSLRYVESGIMCLNGTEMWEDYPDLTLHLHSTGAEAAECAADSEKSAWYCSQVNRQKGISVLDKMRVNSIIVERLYSNGKYDELWTTCMNILDKLGCKLPRNERFQQLEAALCLQETKRYMPSSADVDEMAMIRNPMKREALAFMIKAASFGMGSNRKSLYILLCCRCVRWTRKYGVTASTASAFASFANVLMHEKGDWQTAVKIAELALTIEKRFGSSYTKTSTLQKTNSFVLGWVKPLRNCRTDYTKAYKLGMLSGNTEGVGMAVLFLLMCQFFSGGTPLPGLEADLRKYIPHLENLKLHTYTLGLRLLWQKVLNLIGANDFNPQTTKLIGTAMHGIDIEKHPFIYSTAGRHHIVNMCAYFSEYEKGAEISLAMGGIFYKSWSGAAYFGFETFSRAVCLYAMAIKTGGQQKYLKPARRARTEISKWVKQGAINLLHQLYLLDAEDAAVKGRERQAKSLYNKAIKSAVRGGFLGDAGIANERYAVYLESLSDHKDEASHHMNEAVYYYSEWGASRKVRLLREEHSEILNRPKA